MKNFRVLKTVNTKRIISGFGIKSLGMILLFLFTLPYLITFLFGNLKQESEKSEQSAVEERLTEGQYRIRNRTGLGEEVIPLELYVADALSGTMAEDAGEEALKAQAILIRTNLFRKIKTSEEEGGNILQTEDDLYGSREVSEKIYRAVAETAGQCVVYEGLPIVGAYFAVSNGMSRSGEEAGLLEMPYLKSVPCGRDYLAEDYSSSQEWGEEEFRQIWESLPAEEVSEKQDEFSYSRDGAGYVLFLEYQEKRVSGEVFREAFGLASACFSVKKENRIYVIEVKGAGHGFGMSRYTAELLAAEGKTYTEILEYFFQNVTIVKIE